MQRLQTAEELIQHVKSAQDAAFVTKGLARTNLDEDEVGFYSRPMYPKHKYAICSVTLIIC